MASQQTKIFSIPYIFSDFVLQNLCCLSRGLASSMENHGLAPFRVIFGLIYDMYMAYLCIKVPSKEHATKSGTRHRSTDSLECFCKLIQVSALFKAALTVL